MILIEVIVARHCYSHFSIYLILPFYPIFENSASDNDFG